MSTIRLIVGKGLNAVNNYIVDESIKFYPVVLTVLSWSGQ